MRIWFARLLAVSCLLTALLASALFGVLQNG